VTALIWGWGVAQHPYLLPGTTVTLSNAGEPPTPLDAVVVLSVVTVALAGPSFVLPIVLQHRRPLQADEEAEDLPAQRQ
jgi:cytochrome bd ubiquinol oxidase subunit II